MCPHALHGRQPAMMPARHDAPVFMVTVFGSGARCVDYGRPRRPFITALTLAAGSRPVAARRAFEGALLQNWVS